MIQCLNLLGGLKYIFIKGVTKAIYPWIHDKLKCLLFYNNQFTDEAQEIIIETIQSGCRLCIWIYYIMKRYYQKQRIESRLFSLDDVRYKIISKDKVIVDRFLNTKTPFLYVPSTVHLNGQIYNVVGLGKGLNSKVGGIFYDSRKDDKFDTKDEFFDSFFSFVGLILPDSIRYIHPKAFKEMSQLLFIRYNGNSSYFMDRGVIYSRFPYEAVIAERRTKSIKLRESLVSIRPSAFAGCKLLKKIVIPASVVRIESRAFDGATSLENLKFSKNSRLETIGDNAFSCTKLSKIHFPSSLQSIGLASFTCDFDNQIIKFDDDSKLKRVRTLAFNRDVVIIGPERIRKMIRFACFIFNK